MLALSKAATQRQNAAEIHKVAFANPESKQGGFNDNVMLYQRVLSTSVSVNSLHNLRLLGVR